MGSAVSGRRWGEGVRGLACKGRHRTTLNHSGTTAHQKADCQERCKSPDLWQAALARGPVDWNVRLVRLAKLIDMKSFWIASAGQEDQYGPHERVQSARTHNNQTSW